MSKIVSIKIIDNKITALMTLRSDVLSIREESDDDSLQQCANLLQQVAQKLETERDFLEEHQTEIYE